jgi:hypothetical protein
MTGAEMQGRLRLSLLEGHYVLASQLKTHRFHPPPGLLFYDTRFSLRICDRYVVECIIVLFRDMRLAHSITISTGCPLQSTYKKSKGETFGTRFVAFINRVPGSGRATKVSRCHSQPE